MNTAVSLPTQLPKQLPTHLPKQLLHAHPTLTLAVDNSRLVLRTNGQDTTLHNGDLIQIDGRMVVVVLGSSLPPSPAEQNPGHDAAHRVVVRFAEDERVTVLIAKGQSVTRVVGPRQAALLAELVGLRLRDRRKHIAPEEEGFTDKYQLGRAMDIDPDYINTLLTRLKLRATSYGFANAAAFIETRDASLNATSRAQQLRLAVPQVRII